MSDNPYVNQSILAKAQQADKLSEGQLDLTNLDLEIDIPNMQDISNDDYIMYRRKGLGTSDSSVVLGVNPYKTLPQLIEEKLSTTISEEERAIGKKSAVMKGKDLEPLIIAKWARFLNRTIIKPLPQYVHKEFKFLKFNFDGVHYEEENQRYIPDEIKVVTYRGQHHYDPNKNYFDEDKGFFPLPENHGLKNNSIEIKAAQYGIPPYYYTQLQQQIFGLNAPYGYLTVLFESTWRVHSWFVWRDDAVIRQLILSGASVWKQITGG